MVFDRKSSTISSPQSLADKIPLAKVQPKKVHATTGTYAFLTTTNALWQRQFRTQPAKVAGTLRRAARHPALAGASGERHLEYAYYFDFCRLCQFKPNPVRNLATIGLTA
jgi:hypothetical protein